MARTHESKVLAIISSNLTTTQLQTFIGDAALWVDEELTNEGYSEGRLEIIERYLACALIRVRELGLKSVTFKEAAEQFQVDPKVTDYLVRAASFDSSGKVRRHFLNEGGNSPRPVVFQTGALFKDETPAEYDE